MMANEPQHPVRALPVPSDPRFPHIAAAFDSDRMRGELQQAWFGAGHTVGKIVSCEIEETLYRPGKSCVLVYRVLLSSGASSAHREQLACVSICERETGAQEHVKASARPLVPVGGLPPLVYLPALECLVWAFPNDPRLAGLPAMFDLGRLRATLLERLALPGLARHALRGIETEVMHYRPAETCMVRYRLQVESSPDPTDPLIVYGKMHADGDVVAMHGIMAQLAQQHPGDLRTARPLAYDTASGVLWQSHVTGDPVSLRGADPDALRPMLAGVGRCVGAFHLSTIDSPRVFEVDDVLGRLDKTVALVARVWPDLTERVRAVVQRLARLAAGPVFAGTPRTPVHRDLKAGNFLWDGRTAGLIDTGGVRMGDPLSDVASLVVSLSTKAIQLGWDAAVIEGMAGQVVDAYDSTVSWPVRCPRLDWHVAAAFVYESTWRSMRQWDPEKLHAIPAYLASAERHTTACETQTAGPVPLTEAAR